MSYLGAIQTMRIIYPLNPLRRDEADEPYQQEFMLVKKLGMNCSLFDFDVLEFDEFEVKPSITDGEDILYRGWMLSPKNYQRLLMFIKKNGGNPITSYDNYIQCHHLPSWYSKCVEYTAETFFFADDSMLEDNILNLDWDAYFVKDYVKSNSTERGSIAFTAVEVLEIVALIKKYRGEIEGGIAIRRVEDYQPESEVRYFIFNGIAYSPNDNIPTIVQDISKIINAPFYSVDLIKRGDGVYRLVELGDGQVSDKKTWDIEVFIKMLNSAA